MEYLREAFKTITTTQFETGNLYFYDNRWKNYDRLSLQYMDNILTIHSCFLQFVQFSESF